MINFYTGRSSLFFVKYFTNEKVVYQLIFQVR
jgi:hypothetical protein